MTLIQCLALFGVFVIGGIVGGWLSFRFFSWCMRLAIVEHLDVTACANPECMERHLQLRLRNPVAALGTYDVAFRLAHDVLREDPR